MILYLKVTNIATHIVAIPLSEPDVLLIIDEAGLDLG